MKMTEYHKIAVKLINRLKRSKDGKIYVDVANNEDEYFVANKMMEKECWLRDWKAEVENY